MKYFHRISIYIGATLLGVAHMHAQSISQEAILKARQYYYQGALEEGQERVAEARALYEYAYRLDSTNAEVMYALGNRYLQDSYSEKAYPLLSRAYQRDSLQRDYAMAYAKMLISNGDEREQGMSVLESWLRRNPSDEDAQQLLGSMYLRTGHYEQAMDLFGRLQRENKSLFVEYLRLSLIRVRLYLALNNKKTAQAELEELMQAFPSETLAKVKAVELLQENGLHQEALPYIQKMEQEGSVTLTTLNQMYINHHRAVGDSIAWEGVLRTELEDMHQNAETKMGNWIVYLRGKAHDEVFPGEYNWVFERILSQSPDNTTVQFQYAKILEAQGNVSKSVELLLSLSKTKPEYEELWPMLLLNLGAEKRYKEVIELGKRAEQYAPNDWRNYYFTSISYFLSDRKPDAAIAYLLSVFGRLEQGQVSDYGLSMLYAQLGDFYEYLGDRKKVYAAYDKALEYNEDNTETLNNYAYYLALEGKELERAERMALRGLKHKDGDKNLLDTYAWILYLRGQYSLADLYMRKAIEAAAEDIRAVYYDHYGYILLAQGNEVEAEKQWLLAKELYMQEIANAEEAKEKKEASAKLKNIEKQLKLLDKNKKK